MQDPILKKIFAIPAMVELLARRYRPGLTSTIDFSTLRELPNEILSELFHIEFQAASDAEMPLRSLVYASLAAIDRRVLLGPPTEGLHLLRSDPHSTMSNRRIHNMPITDSLRSTVVRRFDPSRSANVGCEPKSGTTQ